MKRAARGMKRGAVAAVLVCLALGGCRTGQVTVVEKVRVDTLRLSRNIRDSIYVQDSTHVKEVVRGDTVWLEVTRWKTRERERVRVDTVYRAKVDGVEKVVVKERKLTAWERARLGFGGWAMGALMVVILFTLLKRRWP
jgi:hypothetical protein